jgi:hypothetical protein
MLLPGLKKLKNRYDFKVNHGNVYGFRKECFVMLMEGQGKKLLWIDFPQKLDKDDVAKVESWHRKGYASELTIIEDDCVQMEFKEVFLPFKVAKIGEIIDDLTDYSASKYPDAHHKCHCDGCTNYDSLQVYEVDGIPTPLCPECAKSLKADAAEQNAAFDELANNYEQGALLAAVFSIPGILVSVLFYALGRLSSASGIVYFFLAMKGYTWAKGKLNKVGICIISLISLAFSALGTYVGFIFSLVKEMGDAEELAEATMGEKIEFAVALMKDPEVHSAFTHDLVMTLFLCGLSIAYAMYTSWKSVGKSKIEQLD